MTKRKEKTYMYVAVYQRSLFTKTKKGRTWCIFSTIQFDWRLKENYHFLAVVKKKTEDLRLANSGFVCTWFGRKELKDVSED